MTTNTIGYFMAKSGKYALIDVLVEIEIPSSAITNINRATIYDKLNATYLTTDFIVKKIYDEFLNEYSLCYIYYDSIKINIGDVFSELKLNNHVYVNHRNIYVDKFGKKRTEDDDFDIDIDLKKTPYHFLQPFYISKKTALTETNKKSKKKALTKTNNNSNDTETNYYTNGRKYCERYYKNGVMDGIYYEWFSNGNIKKIQNYSNGFLNGESKVYHKQGELKHNDLYSEDKLIEKLDLTVFKKEIKKLIGTYNQEIFLLNDEKLINFMNEHSEVLTNSTKISKKMTSKISNKKISFLNDIFDDQLTIFNRISQMPVFKPEMIEYKNKKLKFIITNFLDKINNDVCKNIIKYFPEFKKQIENYLTKCCNYYVETDNQQMLEYINNVSLAFIS
jgi:hypothetical protein